MPDGCLLSLTRKSARVHVRAENLTRAPAEELYPHDIDTAERWLDANIEPDCRLLLAIWNLAGDVARRVSEPHDDRGAILDVVYDKLFLGSNLPSVTSPGEQHHPGPRRNSACFA